MVPASPRGLGRILEQSTDRKVRLVSEGNWKAFCERKQRYREQGSTPKEADILAHHDFPPPGAEVSKGWEIRAGGSVSEDGTDEVVEIDLSVPDIRRDAYWAYNQIGVAGVVRAQAPSQGAWNMLRHFGNNGSTIRDFLEEIAKPLLKSEPQGELHSDDGRVEIALCERFRAEKVAELTEA